MVVFYTPKCFRSTEMKEDANNKKEQKAAKPGRQRHKGTRVGGPRTSGAARASLSVGKTEARDDGTLSLRDKGAEDGKVSILKQFVNGAVLWTLSK